MAVNKYYYYVLKNKDISGIIHDNNFPYSDPGSFDLQGMLSGSVLNEQQTKEINYQLKYTQNIYPKNGIILDSGATKPPTQYQPNPEINKYSLLEEGDYYIIDSAAGGRGPDRTRFIGTWKINIDNDNSRTKDVIYIYRLDQPKTYSYTVIDKDKNGQLVSVQKTYTYTWKRIKSEADEYYVNGNEDNQNTNVTIWMGNYTYLNNTIFLNLLSYGGDPISDPIENYGILMFKRDIKVRDGADSYNNQKLKLFSYRIDDEDDDIGAKYNYSDGLCPYGLDWNTLDGRGGDGKLYNEVVQLNKDNLHYYVGNKAQNQNQTGGNSTLYATDNTTFDLIFNTGIITGGPVTTEYDFGGRGGTFIYDYYKRIIYNPSLPEDGHLTLTYLGLKNQHKYELDIIPDNGIAGLSYPKNEVPAGILVIIGIFLKPDFEIDFGSYQENSDGSKSIIGSEITMKLPPEAVKQEETVFPLSEYNEVFNGFDENDTAYVERRKATLTDIDYYRIQFITFVMPSRDVKINLKTKDLLYRIHLIEPKGGYDRYVSDCSSNGTDLKKEDALIKAGTQIEISLTYTNSGRLVNEDIFAYTLCLNPGDPLIENDQNKQITFKNKNMSKQIIEFVMPSRNVLIDIITDATYNLTIKLNDYQKIEEDKKNELDSSYKQRLIKNAILIKYGYKKETINITSFPIINEAKYGNIFDLYVKFPDIYMHLDKSHLYSQYPELYIEEAGEFDTGLFSPEQQLPKEITDVITEKRGYEEFYQHIRFEMPENTLTLNLLWIERLYKIDYDIRSEFFEITQIKDSTKKIDIAINTSNETMELMRQANFPYYTYPMIETYRSKNNEEDYPPPPSSRAVEPHIIRNSIIISSTLKSYQIVKENYSSYKVGDYRQFKFTEGTYFRNMNPRQSAKYLPLSFSDPYTHTGDNYPPYTWEVSSNTIKLFDGINFGLNSSPGEYPDDNKYNKNSNNILNYLVISNNNNFYKDKDNTNVIDKYKQLFYEFLQPNLTLRFYMPKDNIKITLNVGVKIDYTMKYRDYERAVLIVNPGDYRIEIKAGDGAKGSDGSGKGSTGGQRGEQGGLWMGKVHFEEITTLECMVGVNGGQGEGGSSGGLLSTGAGASGSGGGGSSCLLFSNKDTNNNINAIYCIGGKGGKGGDGGRGGSGFLGFVKGGGGGSGGSGGGWEWDPSYNGNGDTGCQGGSGFNVLGYLGVGQVQTAGGGGSFPGAGWSRNNIAMKNTIIVKPDGTHSSKNEGKPGHIYITCLKEDRII
jgi:hypothetical protein